MIKIRLSGTPEDLEASIPLLEENFIILTMSPLYKNNNSIFYHQYLDLERKQIVLFKQQ